MDSVTVKQLLPLHPFHSGWRRSKSSKADTVPLFWVGKPWRSCTGELHVLCKPQNPIPQHHGTWFTKGWGKEAGALSCSKPRKVQQQKRWCHHYDFGNGSGECRLKLNWALSIITTPMGQTKLWWHLCNQVWSFSGPSCGLCIFLIMHPATHSVLLCKLPQHIILWLPIIKMVPKWPE